VVSGDVYETLAADEQGEPRGASASRLLQRQSDGIAKLIARACSRVTATSSPATGRLAQLGLGRGEAAAGDWRAASSSMAQRLWLTTSTLCPSGSRTNAP